MPEGLTNFDTLVAWMVSATTLVSFALIMIFTIRSIAVSVAVGLVGSLISWLGGLYLLVRFHGAHEPITLHWTWLASDKINIPFGFHFDPLSLLMLFIVVTISGLVQLYSIGYMSGDPGKSRFYACLCLFAWSMINLVIAPGLLQLYIFWELVGVSSYLLIGFYFEKWSASEAGKKAFVMTRAGDIGFFIGLVLLMLNIGHLNVAQLNDTHYIATHVPPWLVTVSAILIFTGAMGKSAQFPLMTWLPDAMEGPTPVSALLHSATMVAAGVYLIARIHPFCMASQTALTFMLVIGTITMLLASTMAMVARDIKQVWAYSTVSQLGFMVMALGAGAYFAGVFHLTTHAFFKALLFLCAGVFIHHFETNDFFEMSKAGARKMLIPMIMVTIGVAALSGLPFTSGFWSKEAVMGALAAKHNQVWFIAGLIGALMTAYYSFRVIFTMWFPKGKAHGGHGEGHGGHGEGHAPSRFAFVNEWSMLIALIILGTVTLALGVTGWFNESLNAWLTAGLHGAGHGGEHHNSLVPILAMGCAGLGLLLAAYEFGWKDKQEGFLAKIKPLETLFAKRWYMDHAYRKLLDYVVYGGFTNIFTRNDRVVIDGAIDGVSRFTTATGRWLSRFQSGMLQYNLMLTIFVIALLGLYFYLV